VQPNGLQLGRTAHDANPIPDGALRVYETDLDRYHSVEGLEKNERLLAGNPQEAWSFALDISGGAKHMSRGPNILVS
jgi:hypothetical protein